MIKENDAFWPFCADSVRIDKQGSGNFPCFQTLCGHIETKSRSRETLAKQVLVMQQRLVAEKGLALFEIGRITLMIATHAGKDEVDVGQAFSSLLQHCSDGIHQFVGTRFVEHFEACEFT